MELMLANYSYVVLEVTFFSHSLLLFAHELCEEQKTKETTAKKKKKEIEE